MSAVDDPKVLGRTRLSFANEAEIDTFVATLGRFERGEIGPDEWRAFRLVHGTYGQRQDGVQMLRVKIPQGILDAPQLQALADVAERYSRGFAHVTTRQNVQLHFIKPSDVEAAMRRLAEAGLTTREACGNSVRNITGCPYAGVATDEPFDVTPYAEALTRYLLRHPLSSSLPRKFKIAFEGCAEDHAVTSINDIGFRALTRDGGRGFRVTIGGGTATVPTSGRELFAFLPAAEILDVAEAVVRVFHRLGDREHKNRNRMKFLIRELGWDAWQAEFHVSLSEVRRQGGARLPFDAEDAPVEKAPDWRRAAPPSAAEARFRAASAPVRGPGILPTFTSASDGAAELARWEKSNVRPQKQAGFSLVAVTLPLGDITGRQLCLLADLAIAFGDAAVRTTPDQDLLFRWVRNEDVRELHTRLLAGGLGLPDAHTIADVTSCPGAESCRLAVTQSRGLGRLLGEHLRARPDLTAEAADLSIKISGCPNGCGQHHIAGLGFQGSATRVDGKALPRYFLMAGGGVDGAGAHFGRIAARIPARRVPETLDRLLALYRAEKLAGETATRFFRRIEVERLRELVLDLERLKPEELRLEDFVDLGESTAYAVQTMDGECAT